MTNSTQIDHAGRLATWQQFLRSRRWFDDIIGRQCGYRDPHDLDG
jgi:hypothetical protein